MAIARPRPRDAPVTSATRPTSEKIPVIPVLPRVAAVPRLPRPLGDA
jgi:hypothetical protein